MHHASFSELPDPTRELLALMHGTDYWLDEDNRNEEAGWNMLGHATELGTDGDEDKRLHAARRAVTDITQRPTTVTRLELEREAFVGRQPPTLHAPGRLLEGAASGPGRERQPRGTTWRF